jgi:hypothetical protein
MAADTVGETAAMLQTVNIFPVPKVKNAEAIVWRGFLQTGTALRIISAAPIKKCSTFPFSHPQWPLSFFSSSLLSSCWSSRFDLQFKADKWLVPWMRLGKPSASTWCPPSLPIDFSSVVFDRSISQTVPGNCALHGYLYFLADTMTLWPSPLRPKRLDFPHALARNLPSPFPPFHSPH